MGSRSRLNAIMGGDDPLDVWNQRADPAYKVRNMGDVVKADGLGIDGDMKNAKVAKDVMPNTDRPNVAKEKISGYILSPDNEKGRHKAKVLAKAFGLEFNDSDAEYLRSALSAGLASGTVVSSSASDYGRKYKVNITITGKNGHVEEVETGWIMDEVSDTPRLLTAYLRGKKK